MAFSFILAARFEILESIFGGLDRVYRVHRWSGIWAVFSIIMHWQLVPQSPTQRSDWSLIELGSDTGEWATWILLFLVAISFLRVLPYHWWKWTHRFMGVVFVITVFHYVFSLKPFGLFSPAGIAMNVTSVVGVYAWWYYYKNKSNSKNYLAKVSHIKRTQDNIVFEAEGVQGLPLWKAGQFAFISFPNHPVLSTEEHPFTIASSSHNGRIRFSVSTLGDFTKNLHKYLQKGDLVKLNIPYGRFTLNYKNKQQIWIGAGVGITPFLAWLQELQQTQSKFLPDVTLYYSVKNEEKAIFLKELETMAHELYNVDIIIHYSDNGRLTANDIFKDLGNQVQQSSLYFCGPEKFRETIQHDLEALGLPKNSTYFELFDFRKS